MAIEENVKRMLACQYLHMNKVATAQGKTQFGCSFFNSWKTENSPKIFEVGKHYQHKENRDIIITYLKQKLEDISLYCGATDTPVLHFW